MSDRTLIAGGILRGRHDRSLAAMAALTVDARPAGMAHAESALRARARGARDIVRWREEDSEPTHTVAFIHSFGQTFPVGRIDGFLTIPGQQPEALVERYPGMLQWLPMIPMGVRRDA